MLDPDRFENPNISKCTQCNQKLYDAWEWSEWLKGHEETDDEWTEDTRWFENTLERKDNVRDDDDTSDDLPPRSPINNDMSPHSVIIDDDVDSDYDDALAWEKALFMSDDDDEQLHSEDDVVEF